MLHSDNINQAVLFYGSQTGTAEDLATRFAKELADTYGVGTLVCDPEDYDMQELKTKWPSAQDLELEEKKLVVMFFMATYGEGEPTDNAVEFYDWIMNGRGKVADEGDEEDEMTEEKVFTNVVFSAFGLGNKTYEHYNAMVRRLTKRLVKCGATLVGEAGEGDDDGSLEEDFIKWKSKQLSVMATYFGAKAINNNDKPHVPLFDVYEMDGTAAVEAQSKTFYGEYTSGKPRRWRKLNSSISEEYEMITPKGEEIYVEIA